MKQKQFRRALFWASVTFALPMLTSLRSGALGAAPGTAASSPFHHASVGYLGVDFEDLTHSQRAAFHLQGKQGVAIAAVDHDAPAGQAGLKVQDVVLRMDGHAVQSAAQARNLLRKKNAGQSMTLTLLRNGQILKKSVQLADRKDVEKRAWSQHYTVPNPAQQPASSPATQPQQNASAPQTHPNKAQAQQPATHATSGFLSQVSSELSKTFGANGILMSWIPGTNALYTGVDMDILGPQLAQYFGVKGGVGLLVQSVDINSPGSRAGIRAGDIVLKVDDVPMTSRSKWQHVVHENRNSLLLLQIQRDRQPMTLTMSVHETK